MNISQNGNLISVVIPAYNESKKVRATIDELVSAMEDHHLDYEVILVDDGSEDGTLAEAYRIAKQYPSVKVCNYMPNKGKGHALIYGFSFTHGNRVIFLDADSELPASQVPGFLEYVNGSNIDILIGSKRHPESQIRVAFIRRFLSNGYNIIVKLLFRMNVDDIGVGLKLFRREVLEKVLPKLEVQRYAFDLELLTNAHRMGYSITEAPVVLQYSFNSRIVIRGIWRIFWDTIGIFYRMKVLHSYDKR